ASGYYRATVESSLSEGEDGWQAHYRVTRGEPLRVTALDLTLTGPAGNDAALQAALPAFPLKTGSRLRHARYESGKRALLDVLREYGYLDVAFTTHRVDVDLDAYTADITLTLDSGARYRFGEVSLEETVIEPSLLRRYGAPQPGEPYSVARLLEYQGALADSGYFAGVEVLPARRDREAHTVPVTVQLSPRPRNAYSAGVGFATDSGPRLRAGHQRRYVNRLGHHLDSALLLSPRDSELSTRYRIPLADPRTEQLTFGAAVGREDTVSARSDSVNVQAAVTRRWGIGRRTLGLDYLVERFDTGSDEATTALLIPSVGWQGTRSDNPLWPRAGWRLDLALRGALDGMLSDLSFVQARAGARYVQGLGRDHRLLGRLELGSTWVDGFGQLPASLRFFAGGDQSVRGFDYQKLGPRDSGGDVVGGRHLLVASLEYEWMFAGDFGAAAFFDTGNAFNGARLNLERGVGVGFRWRSPLGAVRVDLASAISEPGAPLR
ncbi:MAG TPA: outer membrane protein assembly factor, partial [Gammaproteobacteria bacterium]|nr:outer membrane protein assembly factor [Gammaproteobacteria bacterium]MCH79050.1 outer membrane protein assembly factor [Gammaproteobacteria bacterium]